MKKELSNTNKINDLTQTINNSGQGANTIIPDEITGWNWGAFLANWIWAIGNKTYKGLLCLIPIFGIYYIFVLGSNGSKWAWQNKHWNSIEEFKKIQSRWTIVGIVLILATVVLKILSST
jgi:hypothetical protein